MEEEKDENILRGKMTKAGQTQKQQNKGRIKAEQKQNKSRTKAEQMQNKSRTKAEQK